jgi:hypothetical protein
MPRIGYKLFRLELLFIMIYYLSTFFFLKLLFIEPSAIGAASVREPIATIFISKFAVGLANVEVWNGHAVLFSLKSSQSHTDAFTNISVIKLPLFPDFLQCKLQ